MKNKILSLLFTGVFFAVCLVPSVGLLLTGGSPAGANEVLSPRPRLQNRDGSVNTEVLSDLAAYVDDRFSLRQESITAWAKLNASLLNTSTTEDVLLGSDGWLYFSPTLPDYTRTEPMTDQELQSAAQTLYLIQEAVEAKGGRFLFTIAPNKNSLYPGHMPDYSRGDASSDAERLAALLEEMGVHYLDLFAVFNAREEELYFPTDSHWNGRGAALAADAILEALGREGDYYQGDFTPGTHKGDLYEMLYPTGTARDPDYIYAPGFTFTASSQNPDSITITTQSEKGEGELLLYRDSFGRNMYPYMAERYAAAEFSRKNTYDPAPLPEGGDLVIELVELNLRYLNTYAPDRSGVKNTD